MLCQQTSISSITTDKSSLSPAHTFNHPVLTVVHDLQLLFHHLILICLQVKEIYIFTFRMLHFFLVYLPEQISR